MKNVYVCIRGEEVVLQRDEGGPSSPRNRLQACVRSLTAEGPMIRVSLEIPAETVGSVLAAVARLGGTAETPVLRADLAAVPTLLPAARAQDLQRQLPGLTSGEGVAETSFGGYRPVTGPPPARRRTMADPLNREEYMMQLAGRATAASAEQAESSGAR